MTDNEEISKTAAASRYGITGRTLQNYRLPQRRKGREVYYRKADVEKAIAEHAAADQNYWQHPGAKDEGEPPGNFIRSICVFVAGRILVALETCWASDHRTLDWQRELNIDRGAAAVILARAAAIGRAAAGEYLHSQLDAEFLREVGETIDGALGSLTGAEFKTEPPPSDIYTKGEKFSAKFQPIIAQALAFAAEHRATTRKKRKPH
jgi:hypothetical protein